MGVEWLDRASVGLLGRAEHREAGQVIVAPVSRAIAMLGREINRGRMRKVLRLANDLFFGRMDVGQEHVGISLYSRLIEYKFL
jgi:hypothetical protein